MVHLALKININLSSLQQLKIANKFHVYFLWPKHILGIYEEEMLLGTLLKFIIICISSLRYLANLSYILYF